jgi:hypothetical protein
MEATPVFCRSPLSTIPTFRWLACIPPVFAVSAFSQRFAIYSRLADEPPPEKKVPAMSEQANQNKTSSVDPFVAELQAITGTFPPSADRQKRNQFRKRHTQNQTKRGEDSV